MGTSSSNQQASQWEVRGKISKLHQRVLTDESCEARLDLEFGRSRIKRDEATGEGRRVSKRRAAPYYWDSRA